MPENEFKPMIQDLSRLAAYIDGEGCVSIRRAFMSKKGRYFHQLRVQVSNTDGRLPLWLKSMFGGNIHLNNVSGKGKTVYTWEVVGSRAAELLESCSIYMIIKSEQAEVALQFQRELTGFRSNGRGNLISEEIYKKREESCIRLQSIKRKIHPVEVCHS